MSSDSEPPDAGLPEYAAQLAARHAAHGRELIELLRDLWGGRRLSVLDLACGDGFYTAAFGEILDPAGEVVGVDLLPGFLEWAKARAADAPGSVAFVRADAAGLPFPDARFDLAWCAQSLISLPDPAAALRELRRVVRPGGEVAVLENDRLHEMQMPLPVPLELALRRAERRTDDPETAGDACYAGRFLEPLLLEAGLTPKLRRTLTIDRRPPFSKADEAFLQTYLHGLTRRAAEVLAPAEFDELRRLTDPGSPDYLPATPGFWMTWTDVVVVAERPEGAALFSPEGS